MGRRDLMTKEAAEKHTAEVEKLYPDEIKSSIEATRIYGTDFQRNEIAWRSATFVLEQSPIQESVMRNAGWGKTKTAVLNFASYLYPGGGVHQRCYGTGRSSMPCVISLQCDQGISFVLCLEQSQL